MSRSTRKHSSRRSVDDRMSRSQRDEESPVDSSSRRSRHSASAILSPKSERRKSSRGLSDSRRHRDSRAHHSSARRHKSRDRTKSRMSRSSSSSRSPSLVKPRRYQSDVYSRSHSKTPPPPSKSRRHRSDGGGSSYRESTYRESSRRDRSRRSRHYTGDSVDLNEEDGYSDRYEDDYRRDRRRHRHSTSKRYGSRTTSRHHRSRRSNSDSPRNRRRHRSRRDRDRGRSRSSDYSDHRDKDYYDDDRRYYDEKENKRHRRSKRRPSRRDPSSSSYSSEEEDYKRRDKSPRKKSSGNSRRRGRRSHHRRPKRRHSSSRSDRDNQQQDESPMEVAPPRAGVVSEEEEPSSPPVVDKINKSDSSKKKSESSKTADQNKHSKSTKSKRSTSQHNDDVGHFQGGKGSILNEKYSVIREVGVGTFGRVLECHDLSKSDEHTKQRSRPRQSDTVAIKVVRNIKRYYKSARIEADILMDVNKKGGRGLSHCVVMHEAFSFDGHYCMVFESLGSSLYDFMKRQRYQPYPPSLVLDFAQQLLEALEFIHSFKLIHTDLKPENILLVNDREVKQDGYWIPESTKIKVIDFGGATYDNERKSSIVNTRQYRAPEVILGTGWSMQSDMWSAGCILAELYQGELLFATHDNVEHLALIESVIGRFPQWMIERGKQEELIREAFHSDGRHRMERALEPESLSYVQRIRPLESIVYPEDAWFLSMLQRILVIDPNHRATARECLNDSKLWIR